MIRWILATLIVVAAISCVAWMLVLDTGYIYISYRNLSLETSIWVGIVLVTVLVVLVQLFLKSVFAVFRVRRKVKIRKRVRQDDRLLRKSNELNIEPGDVESGERTELLSKLPTKKHEALLAFVQQAELHHSEKEFQARDKVFEEAVRTFPRLRDDLILKQLTLETTRGYSADRFAQIQSLFEERPNHHGVQLLYYRACVKWGMYERVKDLIPKLLKRNVVNIEELDRIDIEIWKQQIPSMGLTTFAQVRKNLPRRLRDRIELRLEFIKYLWKQEKREDAVAAIEQELKQAWHQDLVELFGLFHVNAGEQLQKARDWLNNHPNDRTLHLTIARLAQQHGDFELARDFFERVVETCPSRDIYMELANLSLRLDQPVLYEKLRSQANQLLLDEELGKSQTALVRAS